MKALIILRGLPGAGKTTLANILSEDGKYPVISIDDYFTDKDGRYQFIHSENHKAYAQCLSNTESAMMRGVSKIILHNVFSLEWEMEPYFKMAEEKGYAVFVATIENRHKGANHHFVSDAQIKKMAEKYRVVLLPE